MHSIIVILALIGCAAAFPAVSTDLKAPVALTKVTLDSDLSQKPKTPAELLKVKLGSDLAPVEKSTVLAKEKSDGPAGENRNARVLLVKNIGGFGGPGFGTGFRPSFRHAGIPTKTFTLSGGFSGFNSGFNGFNNGFNSGFSGFNGSPLRFWL